MNADLLIYWRVWPPSYPLACLRATAAFEVPGVYGFAESVNFCFGEYGFGGTSGHTASMTIGGGGSCIQVEQFRRREGAIGVVPARARVTRLGCCDDPDGAVTITASGDTFRSQTFATNFSLERAPAATANQPAKCVDTTLTTDGSQDHPNIVRADGQDSTTVTVGAGCRLSDCPLTISRWLKTDFGSFGGEVNCTTDQASTNQTQQVTIRVPDETATATHRAGCINSGSTNTTDATIQVFREPPTQNSTPLKSVKALHYNGFNFTDLGIADSDMIVPTADGLSPSHDISLAFTEIQTFLEGQNSFLKDFYLSTHTKEGFYDQDEDGRWDSDNNNLDATGDILYQPPTENNPAGSSTFNTDFDNCTGTSEEGDLVCGTIQKAADFIAQASAPLLPNDSSNPLDPLMVVPYRVMPRNMVVTLQKEQQLIVTEGVAAPYPTARPRSLNEAMGCGVTDNGPSDITKLNFVDQVHCAGETFVKRYREAPAALGGTDDNTNKVFHDEARGVRHGYNCSSKDRCTDAEIAEGKGPIVTFFVNNKPT